MFYCYFQEHFFYFQEAELRMDVLQQHAALMGGSSTTSCPLCHKLFLGSESLVEHMKVHHNDPTTVSQAVVQSEWHNINRHEEKIFKIFEKIVNIFHIDLFSQVTLISVLVRIWPNAERPITRARCVVNTTWMKEVSANIWLATRKQHSTPNSGCGRVLFVKPYSLTNQVSQCVL